MLVMSTNMGPEGDAARKETALMADVPMAGNTRRLCTNMSQLELCWSGGLQENGREWTCQKGHGGAHDDSVLLASPESWDCR